MKMNIDEESKIIQEFVDKGNFHAAMNIAISAMNECRRDSDQSAVNHFIDVIKGIANRIDESFGSRRD
jgi:hypothetical protein